jgi:hypothetical protein
LVLHKNNLLMCATSNPIPPQSTYKKGKITLNAFGKNFWRDFGNAMATPGSSVNIVQRIFATGEKFWVTNVDVNDDGVVFRFFSDPVDDVRYFGELKFPFPKKGQTPPADELMNTIAEVLTVDAADNSVADSTTGEATPPPIAPPPPPSDTPPPPPKRVALGDTKNQVVATFGQPQKAATVGAKEIYYYTDMKVTFVDGKVADVN